MTLWRGISIAHRYKSALTAATVRATPAPCGRSQMHRTVMYSEISATAGAEEYCAMSVLQSHTHARARARAHTHTHTHTHTYRSAQHQLLVLLEQVGFDRNDVVRPMQPTDCAGRVHLPHVDRRQPDLPHTRTFQVCMRQ